MGGLDWALLGCYFALLVVIGVQTSRKIKSSDDFAVAGNRIIWPVFFGSFAAAFLGGGASIGNAGATFRDGYVYMFAFSAFAVQTVLIGIFVAPRLKRYLGAHTVGDVMEHHYGRASRLVTGLLSLGLCAGILGAQALAVGTVVNATVGLPIVPSIVVGMAVVVAYSTFGGAWAVIQTDMVQFVFLGVFLPVTLLLALGDVGGPTRLVEALPEAHLSLGGTWSLAAFASLFVAFLLGEVLVPPYAQRTFSATDARAARKGFVLTGFFAAAFFFITATIGLTALVLFPGIEPDQALTTVVMKLVPAGIVGLVVAALLSVVMSTASSYLNSIAVIFVKDIYQPFVKPDLGARERLWWERALSLVVGVAATLFAISAPSIVDALLYAYAMWAPTIVIPLLAAVLFGSRSRAAALSSIGAGVVVTVLWIWLYQEQTGVDGLVVGAGANLVVFALVALFTRNRIGAGVRPAVEEA
ncbi:sodium:solute symporter family protein [Saccharopolyspora shandongensis]|uniref:sodium:solute symporter family protein n=1 Tax=Saccharopolyspora shandongensis TaxID=418495 RepID=UPI0033EAF7D8